MAGPRTLDPYAVLGVPREATPLQVARAHRRLAKRHHPDLHEGATDAADAMRRINEAWWVLSNPIRRADYDRAHPSKVTDRRGWPLGRVSRADPAGLSFVDAHVGNLACHRRRDARRASDGASARRDSDSPHPSTAAARADARDVPRLGLGGAARRGADRSAPGGRDRDRPPHPLTGASRRAAPGSSGGAARRSSARRR